MTKQVLLYLKDTSSLGIKWERDLLDYKFNEKYGEIRVIEYADSRYISDIKNQRLIIRYYFFVGRGIVTWSSKQQYTVSTSISEVDYIAISQRAKEKI